MFRCTHLFLFAIFGLCLIAKTAQAQQNLFVTSAGTNEVKQYDGTTGAFLNTFVTAGDGGLSQPVGITFGPDQNLYVTGHSNSTVKRYNGTTGVSLGDFGNGLSNPGQLKFGPDGNLYVSNRNSIARFDGATGASLGAITGGGMNLVLAVTFTPSGDLLAASQDHPNGGPGIIKRYNPTTGDFLGDFVIEGSGELSGPLEMTFGADNDLYVASQFTSSIKRYNGTTGTYLGNFVPAGNGGLTNPVGMAFGPDGNLYVSNYASGPDGVLRYDGTTGDFKVLFASGGGLVSPQFLAFGPQSVPTAVPEPGAIALLTSIGIVGTALIFRWPRCIRT